MDACEGLSFITYIFTSIIICITIITLGDGGSSLSFQIQNNPDRYVAIGLVSWGIDCGLRDVPGVYVNVANYKDWIDSILYENMLIPTHDVDLLI